MDLKIVKKDVNELDDKAKGFWKGLTSVQKIVVAIAVLVIGALAVAILF